MTGMRIPLYKIDAMSSSIAFTVQNHLKAAPLISFSSRGTSSTALGVMLAELFAGILLKMWKDGVSILLLQYSLRV